MAYLELIINGETRRMELGYIENVTSVRKNFRWQLSKATTPHIVSNGTNFKNVLRNDRPDNIYLHDGTIFATKKITTANDYKKFSVIGFNDTQVAGMGVGRGVALQYEIPITTYDFPSLQNYLGGTISVSMHDTIFYNTNNYFTFPDMMIYATDEIIDGVRTIIMLPPNILTLTKKEILYYPYVLNEAQRTDPLQACSFLYEDLSFGWQTDIVPVNTEYVQNWFDVHERGTLKPINFHQLVLGGNINTSYIMNVNENNTCDASQLMMKGYCIPFYVGSVNATEYSVPSGGVNRTLYQENGENIGDGDNPQPTPKPPIPDPDYPDPDNPTPDEPPDPSDIPSDDISPPIPTPSLTFAARLISAYSLNALQIDNLASELWTTEFWNNIIKLFVSPMDCIISLTEFPLSIPVTVTENIVIGNVKLETTGGRIVNPFITVDMGSLSLQELYKSYLDYTQTRLHIYLPFIGVKQLSVDYINAQLSLRYNIDVLSGTCVAILSVNSYNSNLNSVVAQWEGNMGYQIPLSGRDYSQMASALWNIGVDTLSAVSSKTPNLVSSASKLGNDIINLVETANATTSTGNLQANSGHLSVLEPFLIITYPKQKINKAFYNYKGREFNGYTNFSTLTGYTEISHCELSIPNATADEMTEIERLLSNGVYF